MPAIKTILVTGASGFIGRNLVVSLRRQSHWEVREYDVEVPADSLEGLVAGADLVYHLAGVNRDPDPDAFTEGNSRLTRRLCALLAASDRRAMLVLSSSIQAEQDHPYGRSKREAEEAVLDYHQRTRAPVRIYRFPNVFGKWSRPNYNSVVATFCHNISRDLPVTVSDPARAVSFVYIDDVVRELEGVLTRAVGDEASVFGRIAPTFTITLGELHERIASFRSNRHSAVVPDLSDPLTKCLYATYLSFCDPRALSRQVDIKRDARGWLFEWMKSPASGQVFVSSTQPGVTRGNHYHDTKVEKFCVVQGRGIIRLLPVCGGEVISSQVDGAGIRVVDIPPGYAHSIENTGSTEMITLFWASEMFDPQRPDTFPAAVVGTEPQAAPE